eukprot:TRINITY_DN1976_c0_g1_i2.p1 TRINITY_DN1976_c0_g1~~TRINITY_DN1976_c0_g1_i2.p1  ORF type:complete len:450 (+),score=122.96 TRINITY_DN1976_c0_g1_i2:105-1352(+)
MESKKTCSFWLKKKSRYCKFDALEGDAYCQFHSESCVANGRKRVRCPLDPTHYVPENEVERHIKVCPALFHLEAKSKPYYRKAVHRMVKDKEEESAPITMEELESVAARVDSMFKSLFTEITPSRDQELKETNLGMDKSLFEILRLPSESGSHFDGKSWRSGMEEFDSVWKNVEEMGKKRRKHGIQGMAICECLHLLGVVREKGQLCVEFGAGRAGLSSILSRAGLGTSFALIERENSKKKYDMEIREGSVWIERVRLDIEDVWLPSLVEISGQHDVLGVGKHLCGGGTDVCLKCMCSYESEQMSVSGVVIALCCHHKMDFGSYVLEKDELRDILGISTREFNVLCKLTSWYTCNMESEERERIGWMSKRLIDIGRMMYLRRKGFENVFLMEYVPSDISKENVLLVALNHKSVKS